MHYVRIYLFSSLVFFTLPSLATIFTPSTVSELIAHLNASQTNSQNDIVDLGGNVFTLTAVDNSNGGLGANGLPYLNEVGYSLTIKNGEIRRAPSAPRFRFLLNNSTLSLDGVVFRNGFAERGTSGATRGGAIYNLKDIVLINNCQFINNQVEGSSTSPIYREAMGGALAIYKGRIGRITNSLFDSNFVIAGSANSKSSPLGLGGAISIEYSGGIDTISATTFSNNRAVGGAASAANAGVGGHGVGGAIGVYFGSTVNSISSVRDTVFLNNEALGADADADAGLSKAAGSGFGGAIGFFNSKSGLNNIIRTRFESNSARGGNADFGVAALAGDAFGGALYVNPTSRIIRVSQSTFIANEAQGFDGVLNQNPGNAFGGAIAVVGGTLNVFEANTFAYNQVLSGDNFAVANTTSTAKGGAIYLVSSNNIPAIWYAAYDSTYSNNAAFAESNGQGGAIFIEGTNAAEASIGFILNSTFSNNFSTNLGGALALGQASVINDFGNSTVAQNQALAGDGGGISLAQVARIENFFSNIVATNDDVDDDAFADIAMALGSFIFSHAHNLIGVDVGHTLVNGVNNNLVGTVSINLDPLLGPLQNNGGLTQTHALLAASPAIDTGLNFYSATYDQRGSGFLRTIGVGTDIGSFER